MDQQKPSVVFEDESSSVVSRSPAQSGFIGLVMKHSGGLLKTPQQAQYALLALVVTLLIVSGYLILSSPSGKDKPPPRDPSMYAR